ncbi:hypothetical protein KR093_007939, partial [Drosophila rubida]
RSLHELCGSHSDALRSEYRPRRPCALLKYPRPKTKPEYQSLYPWIILDETDPHFVFCAVCECRLSAKRSDLGKHEGSIKHSENAQRKSVLSLGNVKAEVADAVKWEYNDDEDGILPLRFGADAAEMCKTEDDDAEGDAGDDDEVDGDADADGEAEDDDGEVDGDAEVDSEYEPKSKRRVSETDSQNSGMLDFLPLQVTINELPHVQLTPTASQLSAHCQPVSTTPQPCRITIKKVTAPSSSTAMSSSQAQQEITSKATITPITSGCYTPTARQPQPQLYAGRQLQSYQLQHVAARDSLDLFFDSICATVKALPPKLATEGKIRVMQLIGELELRAINEREAVPTVNALSTPPDASASVGTADAPGSSQQNATVASTTK